jgi:hypothetical protein
LAKFSDGRDSLCQLHLARPGKFLNAIPRRGPGEAGGLSSNALTLRKTVQDTGGLLRRFRSSRRLASASYSPPVSASSCFVADVQEAGRGRIAARKSKPPGCEPGGYEGGDCTKRIGPASASGREQCSKLADPCYPLPALQTGSTKTTRAPSPSSPQVYARANQ